MLHYWMKNRLAVSLIASLLLISLISFVFISTNISNIANSYNEMSIYEGSNIDFDVPSPSKLQVNELETLDHIEHVIPYIYTTKSVRYFSSNSLSNVGVLLLDNFDDIELTMYNSSRLIEKSTNYSDNPLIVDYRFIKLSGLTLGDVVQIPFGGSLVSFTIDGIYETNTYYQSNTIMGLWQGDQKILTENSLGRELNYSGAYIVSNSVSVTDNYLINQFKPYGRLRDRSEFDSDAAYQIHYNAFMNSNYANEITSFADLLVVSQDRAANYKQVSQVSLLSGTLLLLVVQTAFSIALIFRKSEIKYFNSKKRTGSSYGSYYIYSMIFEIFVASSLIMLYSLFLWNNLPLYLPLNHIFYTVIMLITSSIIASAFSYLGSKFILFKAS